VEIDNTEFKELSCASKKCWRGREEKGERLKLIENKERF
jgi:hypothetical protein